MGTAAQIRRFRVRAGKSPGEVAECLGLNSAWYHDLERHDDELASTLTLFQAMELAAVLGVQLHQLLGNSAPSCESISLMEIPSRINALLVREGISITQFEERIGWEVRPLLSSPIKAVAEFPIVFLQAIAASLDVDWLSFVPDEHAA